MADLELQNDENRGRTLDNEHWSDVLIQAMPYFKQWVGKTVVVKYGGNAMLNEELKQAVMKDIVLLHTIGINIVLVHGGGPEINKMLEKVGKESKFVNGLRVTDTDTMELAEMVLNKVNKELVCHVQELGVNGAGISGKDGGLLKVKKRYADGEDIGFVGEITDVNPQILIDLMEKDFIPIVCPIGMDDEFNTYNINADDAACAIAKAVGAEESGSTWWDGMLEANDNPTNRVHPTALGAQALYARFLIDVPEIANLK